eukprot:3466043-Alexandrium_andersonii.AAC.1
MPEECSASSLVAKSALRVWAMSYESCCVPQFVPAQMPQSHASLPSTLASRGKALRSSSCDARLCPSRHVCSHARVPLPRRASRHA